MNIHASTSQAAGYSDMAYLKSSPGRLVWNSNQEGSQSSSRSGSQSGGRGGSNRDEDEKGGRSSQGGSKSSSRSGSKSGGKSSGGSNR